MAEQTLNKVNSKFVLCWTSCSIFLNASADFKVLHDEF